MSSSAPVLSGTAAHWMILGEWRAHPGRVIVATVAIAIGVALGFAVHLINASALNEFARAIRIVNGDADLQVHATTPFGFDEALYPRLARLEGIAGASPAVELPASLSGTPLTLIGLDPLRAGTVTPSLIGRSVEFSQPEGEDSLQTDSLFLSQAALEASGADIGATVLLAAAGKEAPFRIAGTLPGVAEGQSIGVVDIAAAQWRFGQLGHLQRVDLKLAAGADPGTVQRSIAAVLPPDAEIVSQNSTERRSDSLSRAYRVNLDMLALMALLSGAFLVYSAQALSVARRRTQFALLRVLGMRRRALLAQVLTEGGILGITGAILGLGLGLALASAALDFLGGDLGGGYFDGTQPQLIFAPVAALAFLALGLMAAVIGSVLPAREAARAEPAVALKNTGDTIDPKAAPGARPAMALLALGAAAAMLPAWGELPLFGYVSIALLLAGGVAAMPLVARVVLAPLHRLAVAAVPVDLAFKRLWGAPSQATVALCGIVASTALMIAMAVMITSFRASVDEWMVELLPADLYLHLEGDNSGGLDREMQQRLASAAGIFAIDFRKVVSIRLQPDKPPVAIVVRSVDKNDPAASLPLIGASLPISDGTIPVWISEPFAGIYGIRRGERVALALAGQPTEVFVAGIWRDYARQQGSIVMDNADYTRLSGDTLRTDGAVELATGQTARRAIDAMRAALPASLAARLSVAEPRELRALALRIFDRSFAVTYLLEAIAILVGLSGVAATFSAQTLARTKEFGMLRHVGVRRREIIAMLATEGALLGTVGVVAGIGLGLAIAQVLIHVINPQSFHWTMDTRLPYGLFAEVVAALIAAAAGTALVSGRRALSTDAVRAVREDW